MQKTYYKSPAYAAFIFMINTVLSVVFVIGVLYATSRDQGFNHELFWVSWTIAVIFFLLFMMHFFYIGVFSLVVLDSNELIIKKTFQIDTKIKFVNIKRMETIDDMRLYHKVVERPVILVEGYDEVTKENVTVKIDYRKKLHDSLVDKINDADKKTLMSMDKYFDMHP